MVEFIVLGLVPGTSFQINISHVLITSWFLFAINSATVADTKPSEQAKGTKKTT
ncbi:hypothetical protein BH23PAT2_BH23PAT2_05270 [soil metagenome]